MTLFVITIVGDDQSDDAVTAAHELGQHFVADLKQNDVAIYDATYTEVKGDGQRYTLEAPGPDVDETGDTDVAPDPDVGFPGAG